MFIIFKETSSWISSRTRYNTRIAFWWKNYSTTIVCL